ncbi:MAG TPA: virulence RhuM family protein [Spirochaetota bacterium]|nr:virulence RhuM family protein [Spirochaetota bacterium]HOH36063.1 virulence RhuM family protein [Spirochaetota bacterium]HPJ14217.1 virulence RhuM family protein [Spirochaetota bacterium]HPM34581.1 virulence RhuM family protein [Spirochaetota bacterium]HPY01979.1 virulence RhuM family protein [Spirochaetota bacterium]
MNNNYQSSFIIFKTEDEKIAVDVRFEDETVWLSQEQMALLFERDRTVILKHIANIFSEGELEEKSNVQNLHIANSDKPVKFYNLNVIISVGYRVKSQRGTQFRIWATKRLNEYIRKGFTMDDERLKNLGGGGYWKELLQRIRDIRASEKVFYRQVLDIYATSIDYDPKAEVSIEFFKKVQNKIHYAVHGQTASEVIYTRADAEKEFMGLMTFPGNRPYLKDVVVAKNYLNEKELRSLGQLISGYLDFAERQAEREQAMTMKDWAEHLDKILTMSGEKLLQGAGSISHDTAVEKAVTEYKKYQQKTLSEAEKNYLDSLKSLDSQSKHLNKKDDKP